MRLARSMELVLAGVATAATLWLAVAVLSPAVEQNVRPPTLSPEERAAAEADLQAAVAELSLRATQVFYSSWVQNPRANNRIEISVGLQWGEPDADDAEGKRAAAKADVLTVMRALATAPALRESELAVVAVHPLLPGGRRGREVLARVELHREVMERTDWSTLTPEALWQLEAEPGRTIAFR